jgi:hypothetical protein
MSGEFIVPIVVSLGLMTLMLRTLAFPEFRLQRAHAHGTHRMAAAGQSAAPMAVTNSQPSFAQPTSQDERARFVEGLRRSLSRYQDCRAALADNYLSRASDETQSIWEFTNYWYGFKAAFDFDPDHPTSLIYQRDSRGEYHLIGAAFTSPERFSIEQRHERIPSNIAEWQPHGMFGWVARIYFVSETVEEKGSDA